MDQDSFITAIKQVVHEPAIKNIKSTLACPAGRHPHARLKKLSSWYTSLPEIDRSQIDEIISLAVHSAVFDFLSVLDGVCAIESTPEKGDLILTFKKDGQATRLNGVQGEMLHDIYQSQVQREVLGIE